MALSGYVTFIYPLQRYHSAERDALLATMLDSVRGAGNRDVSVLSLSFDPAMRWAPLWSPPDEEIEESDFRLFILTSFCTIFTLELKC